MIDEYVLSGGKKLRMGITTGTCAALAAQGAVRMLLTGRTADTAVLLTPKGIRVDAPLLDISMESDFASCAVRKDAGDDKDATDGMLIYARAEFRKSDCSGDRCVNISTYQSEDRLEKKDGQQKSSDTPEKTDAQQKSSGAPEKAYIRSDSEAGIGSADGQADAADFILIDGGEGIGRVTLPGLDQPVGEAAINSVPRKMIREAALDVAAAFGCETPIQITISAPAGAEIAKKTFNPRLGIEGGISILGTSGIVEPMSLTALAESIALEIRQKAALGHKRLILTPGNYGLTYLEGWEAENGIDRADVPVVVCSNFIGDALDEAGAAGYADVLLVGHIGKLVKLAGGIMNTHSRTADCRTELFTAHAAVCGADTGTCKSLMKAATTDACIDILKESGLLRVVMGSLLSAVDEHLQHRASDAYRVGAVLFSNVHGFIGETADVRAMLHDWTADAERE